MGSISGKQAAIKAMRKTRLLLEKQAPFVQREREILRRLCTPAGQAHPLIVNCFGTAQDSESVYFGFQPCLGGDFCSVLKVKRRGLPLPTVRYYMAEVLAALEYAVNFLESVRSPVRLVLKLLAVDHLSTGICTQKT